jgi:hypothetical protein
MRSRSGHKMSSPLVTLTAARIARRLPYLRRLPILRLLALGEVLVLAKDHYEKLSPRERRRLVELLRAGRGRPSNLRAREREELEQLIAKTEPRVFAGEAAEKLSPVPLPSRLVNGKRS